MEEGEDAPVVVDEESIFGFESFGIDDSVVNIEDMRNLGRILVVWVG